MKLTKIMLCAAVAGAMTLVASAATTNNNYVVLEKLTITGQAVVNQTGQSNNGKETKNTPTKFKYTVKDIISLLNASPAFKTYLAYQTSSNYTQIPSGAYLAVDVYDSYVWVVLKNGTPLCPLEGYDAVEGNYRYFGETGWDNMSAKYSYNNSTRSGSEQDALSEFYLYFDDYVALSATTINATATAGLKQSAGKASSGTQKLTQKLKFQGTGDVHFKGVYGSGAMKANGSGSGTVATTYFPLYN